MKVCQNPQCHLYNTTDRLRGSKGKKYYQSRRASKFYYGNGHFCTLKCQDDFWGMYADRIIQYIGLIDIPFTRPVESESRYDMRSRISDAVQEEWGGWNSVKFNYRRYNEEVERRLNEEIRRNNESDV